MMNFIKNLFLNRWCAGLVLIAFFAASLPSAVSASSRTAQWVANEVGQRYPGARVEAQTSVQWLKGTEPERIFSIRILDETAKGEVRFLLNSGARDSAEGWIRVAAWMPTKVATRRILPGERLSEEIFRSQEIDVATGIGREMRGLLIPLETFISNLESRQTILEGHVLLATAVKRVPDAKKGDLVSLQIRSGGIRLIASGVVSEPAYLDQQVRVMSQKTKKELIGKLISKSLVEVTL
jgi:flagella basal body P-ring formation protein FlgA